jgi:two-component system, cell cycle sensor histidine kinase and response regulator CckA
MPRAEAAMTNLRVLIVDDSEDDFELLLRELRRGGYTPEALRVDTPQDMLEAIKSPWDVIISDYSMPHCSLFVALDIAQLHGLDVPFIIASGAIGEEMAVRAMKAGAHDFVMKDKLARLAPVIERELREAVVRRERRIAEQEVRYTRQYLASVFNSLPSVLLTATGQGVITQWNAAAEKYMGVPAEHAIGRNIIDVAPWFTEFRQHISDVAGTHASHRFKTVQECSFGNVYFDVTLFPLGIDHSSDIVIRMDDVTELELKQQQLQQAQKMEIVGMLAGGLAHDFNNVLCGITGSVSVLRSKMKAAAGIPDGQLELFLDLMQHAGLRAVDLVKQLLSLSRKKECLVVSFDFNRAVHQAVELCRNTFDRSVEIRTVFSEKQAMVSADPTQIEQVVLNLLVNACHAMTIMRAPGEAAGGVLTVSVGKTAGDRQFSIRHPDAGQRFFWNLTVSDTGVGMDTAMLDKIFDPFFTTKNAEQGTGLGLAMTAAIIKQHEGFIDVQSDPGAGTVFNVYLPVAVQEAALAPPEPAAIVRGEGLVLIADDELITRQALKAILEECGYVVLPAEDGVQALEFFKIYSSDIRAVMLDMIMPRKLCRDTCLALKEIDPQVKIIVMSGVINDARIDELRTLGFAHFIEKPLTMEKVAPMLNRVLKAQSDQAG